MRMVSIVGDSVSTFEGYNPQGYAVFYDREMQARNELNSVYDTWWAKVNQALHAFLCVNNSYSGSKVSGGVFPAGESTERLSVLRTADHSPDIILIYLGFNDFGNGIEVRRPKRWFRKDFSSDYFEEAYDNMIRTIRSYYPNAVVVCGTLMRTKMKGNDRWLFPEKFAGVTLEAYNDAIRKTARKNRCILADIALTGERYETLDGSHPTANGHATLANAWIRCLEEAGMIK